MNILITGASGYIGNKLANLLAEQGHRIHALIRSDAGKAFLAHPNITIFKGDVRQRKSIEPAIKSCHQVYHTAAKVGAWAKEAAVFYDVNVEGTRNVAEAALQAGVKRIVYTSSAGVLGPAGNVPRKEDDERTLDFQLEYDRSKKLGQDVVLAYEKQGMDAVIVSPSKVFGPGLTSHSLTANAIIQLFLTKKVTFIPFPGTYKVSFAYIDDVVNGHMLAMQKSRSGENYILGGENISYIDFFHQIRVLAGEKGRIIQLPKAVIKLWAAAQEVSHKVTGSDVRFPVKSVDHLFSNYTFSSEKAMQQLGYHITPIGQALEETVRFLK